jgi:hypothetical protein
LIGTEGAPKGPTQGLSFLFLWRGLSPEICCVGSRVAFEDVVNLFLQFLSLVPMVEVDDGLFEADRDEQAEDNGGDVNEEAFPGMQGFMRAWTSSMGFGCSWTAVGTQGSALDTAEFEALSDPMGVSNVDIGGTGSGVPSPTNSPLASTI